MEDKFNKTTVKPEHPFEVLLRNFTAYMTFAQRPAASKRVVDVHMFQCTGSPRYMRSFYLRFCIYAIVNYPWSFYMQIRYMRAYFWSPYLSHITRSTCFLKKKIFSSVEFNVLKEINRLAGSNPGNNPMTGIKFERSLNKS